MKLYFARHGESEANRLHVFSNRGRKHGLTELGRQQALALAQRLAGLPLARLITSPLLRAEETAVILGQALQLTPESDDALREYDVGVWEDSDAPAGWEAYRQVQQAWFEDEQWETRMTQGESFADIRNRFMPLIDRLAEQHGRSDTNILLVGHGGTYRCMLPLLADNIDWTFACEYALSNTDLVVLEKTAGGWRCLQWGGQIVHPEALLIERVGVEQASEIGRLNYFVHQLHVDAYPEIFKPAQSIDEAAAFFAPFLNDETHYFFIARLAGIPVGYLWVQLQKLPENALHYTQERLYIHHISIDDAYRRQGIGAALIDEVVALAGRLSIRQLGLDHWAFNDDAHNFFSQQGFTAFNLRMWRRL